MLGLVERLMRLLLTGDDPLCSVLRAQYEVSHIVDLEFSGLGFFANFEVAAGAPRCTPPDYVGGDAVIELEGVEHGAGCILFVRDGALCFLEGYAYDGDWPEHPIVIAIRDVEPVTLASAGRPGADGAPR
ncbi:MAG: hypothetical protein M3680_09560 [Myxococcota bacterium]|nr:hypothetical protein [Myxococcota bacterium]